MCVWRKQDEAGEQRGVFVYREREDFTLINFIS